MATKANYAGYNKRTGKVVLWLRDTSLDADVALKLAEALTKAALQAKTVVAEKQSHSPIPSLLRSGDRILSKYHGWGTVGAFNSVPDHILIERGIKPEEFKGQSRRYPEDDRATEFGLRTDAGTFHWAEFSEILEHKATGEVRDW